MFSPHVFSVPPPVSRNVGAKLIAAGFALVACTGPQSAAAAETTAPLPEKIEFNRHIQPILSEYCYLCHGPDSSSRKPKKNPMRLDRPEFAFAPRKDGEPVIVKGKPYYSLVYERITDIGDPMPPEESHKVMKEEEKELIRLWIEQGAEYQEHWAFIAPKRSDVPENTADGWARNPIDHFIARGLAGAGLAPNRDEEPRRLIRRLAFDLTGLPPRPELVDRYARHPDDATYASIVEELLADPAYGEHWARYWLDAVRYGDTHGIHIDNYRSIWPYRDWVIRAFNANMPFDQFTIEQIAGDMLPDATRAQRVASGYNRCLPTTSEGGAIEDEYLAIYAKDRVDTTFAVWQGLTTGCATCHDHKFDPVTQKEFYSLTAFFRNNTMEAMDGNFVYPDPIEFVPGSGDEERWTEVEETLQRLHGELDERLAASGLVDPEPESPVERVSENPVLDDELGGEPPREVVAKTLVEPVLLPEVTPGPPREPDFGADLNDALVLWAPMEKGVLAGTFDGRPWTAPADAQPTFRAGLAGRAPDLLGVSQQLGPTKRIDLTRGFAVSAWVYGTRKWGAKTIVGQQACDARWVVELRNGSLTLSLRDEYQRTVLLSSPVRIKEKAWNHVVVSFLPGATFQGVSRPTQRVRLFLNGEETLVKPTYEFDGGVLTGAFAFPETPEAEFFLGAPEPVGKDWKPGNQILAAQHVAVFDRPLDRMEAARVGGFLPAIAAESGGRDRLDRDQQRLAALYSLPKKDHGFRDLVAAIARTEEERYRLKSRGEYTLVMQERNDAEPVAHVLVRGDYRNIGEEVRPEVPAVLGGLPEDLPRNRVGLARWLVSGKNPLTARVTMNRYWYYLFGTGIVETVEDLGITGARPSHPDLLDWLAVEFEESGWDLRHMLRLLVNSSTYRQSAVVTPEKARLDPQNRLVSRGPRYRLDAEEIRDLALAASGLLDPTIGGRSVRPYQPEGIWYTVAMKQSDTRYYEQGGPDELYRRSLYTIWKRTAPPPSMEILNAPTREVFCVRRVRTNTPLQALVTLNDPQFVEASRALAAETLRHRRFYGSRLDFIAERLLNRKLTREEKRLLEPGHRDIIAHYRKSPEESRELLSVGEAPLPEKYKPGELAAWTLIASQMLNFDETLNK